MLWVAKAILEFRIAIAFTQDPYTMKRLALSLAVISLGLMAACGKQESAPAAAPAPQTTAAVTTPAPAPAPAAENALGKKVFGSTCSMCHSAGVAGAPKPGDKADWGPRIDQGVDTLYKHALEGFNGAKGQMPARGGNTALKDDEVKAAVDYMVAASR
jgi:cytochrome c5